MLPIWKLLLNLNKAFWTNFGAFTRDANLSEKVTIIFLALRLYLKAFLLPYFLHVLQYPFRSIFVLTGLKMSIFKVVI